VSRSIDRAPDGSPLSAETVIRAVAPNGQYGDGDGYCSISEFTGKRGNDPKLENSMRATATTRAKNRAIADLVGMGEVSAEEVTGGGNAPQEAGPPHGPRMTRRRSSRPTRSSRSLATVVAPNRRTGQIKKEAEGSTCRTSRRGRW
jgi:hypothetical protein